MDELLVLTLPGASPELPEVYPRTRSQSVGLTGKRMTLRCLCRLISQTSFQNSEVCFWKPKPRRSSRLRDGGERDLVGLPPPSSPWAWARAVWVDSSFRL